MTPQVPQPVPRCPRCGYDQSGSVAAWNEHCPLEGTCPECGLRFEWAEIYHPLLRAPRWSFEHTDKSLPRALLSTALRAQWPWTFWRRIRMEHPIAPQRLAALAILGTLAVHALLSLTAWIARMALSEAGRLAAPPVFRRRFGFLYTAPLDGVSSFWPLGRWTAFDGVWILNDSLYVLRPVVMTAIDAKGAVVLAAAMLLPLTFLLLPITLKKARVRPAHIARVAAYGVVFLPAALFASQLAILPGLLLSLAAGIFNAGPRFNGVISALSQGFGWFAAAIMLGAYLAFWGLACTRYLRLDRGWLIVPVLAALSLLACLVALVVVGGGAGWLRLMQF